MDDTQVQLQDILGRLQAVESKTQNIQPTAFLNQFSIDPASSGFLQDFIATPYTTTQPTYTPNKNGYENVYFDSSNYWRYTYANGAWRKLMYDGVFSLVAGTGISLSGSVGTVTISTVTSIKSGTVTHKGNSGTATIVSHGLGRMPTLLRITSLYGTSVPDLFQSVGTYDGTTMNETYSWTGVGTTGGASSDQTNIVNISDHGGNTATATVSMSSSQFILSWTVAGAPGLINDINMLWEVYG